MSAGYRQGRRWRHCLGALVFALPLVLGTATAFAQAQVLQQGVFAIQYELGDERIARAAAEVLLEMQADFDARLPAGAEPIRVIIAPTMAAFRPYAGHYRAEMVAAVALPEEGIIAMKHPALLPQGQQYGSVLRHELAHVLLARNTQEPNVPRWFNEGICMFAAGEYRFASIFVLAWMQVSREVLPYGVLDMMFAAPGNEREFDAAYAQALSMTLFLHDTLGDEAFWVFVRSLDARTFRDAIEDTTGMTALEFWEAWKRTLWKTSLIASLMSGFGVFQLTSLLAIAVYLIKRRQMQHALHRMEQEEAAGDGPLVFDAWDQELEGYTYDWEEDDDEW
jgi:hypothetical protein